MAENAAHITSTVQVQPTIFEVVAQESLMNTMNPAIKTLCGFLSRTHPQRFGWLNKWFEEFYLALSLSVQYNYLKFLQGSFSEVFYGLQRAPKDLLAGEARLSRRQLLSSLFCLSALPYLRTKWNSYRLKLEEEAIVGDGIKSTLLKAISFTHHCVALIYGTSKFVQIVNYISGDTTVYSPLLYLCGVKLIYRDTSKDLSWREMFYSIFTNRSMSTRCKFQVFVKLITQLLEMFAFFVQFLKWWHSDDSQASLTALPVPKPPKTSNKYPSQMCPLCSKPRKIDVALQTSGYLFCYKCIKEYLQEHNKCPITSIPSKVTDLIRIYKSV